MSGFFNEFLQCGRGLS